MKEKEGNPKQKQYKKLGRLLIVTTLLIFGCSILAVGFIITAFTIAYNTGIVFGPRGIKIFPFIVLLLISLFFGTIISFIAARKVTMPMKTFERVTNEVAKGNFDVQLPLTKNEEMNELIVNFNKMVRELKSNETLKSDFISNVSHEFKTPLSTIQAYSKALRNKDLDDEMRKRYEEILDSNIKKLTNLTSNILSLSKIENQEIVASKVHYFLDEEIRQSILSLESEWQKKNIEFDLMLEPVKHFGNKELLSQVWQNLIGNAIKFSNVNGKILISTAKFENKIKVRITDFGIGMDEETKKHIYDKFYQGDTSHNAEGNGLGLALVSRILKILNAEISVTSAPNEGATFVIILTE